MTLEQIEQALKTGQASPVWLADAKDWLASESSTIMDRQLELQISFAKFDEVFRDGLKSDKALLLKWQRQPGGLEQLTLETRQKKIKVLREAISSHLRVASDAARNLY